MNAVVSSQISRAIKAHGRYQHHLGAYMHWSTPQYSSQQDGPLSGWPVSVKDHFGVTNWPTYAGTRQRLPLKWEQDGPFISRLRKTGAVMMGKTTAVELAFGGLGVNRHWGSPRNPWDAEQYRVAGGSTSGGGVSLWEGSARLAIGTDTGGSVRIPASFTHTVGLKCSYGRFPMENIVPLSQTLDSIGFLTLDVADMSTAFTALTGEIVRTLDRPPRIGVMQGLPWQDLENGIGDVIEMRLMELARAGAVVHDLEVPEAKTAFELLQTGSVVAAECDEFIDAELPQWRSLLDQFITARLADGGDVTAREYLQRQRLLDDLTQKMASRFESFDVLVGPTVPISPPIFSAVNQLSQYRRANLQSLRNTCLANFSRCCALSLPVGLDGLRLPVGLQLLAPAGRETALLSVASWMEARLGTSLQNYGLPPLLANP